MGLRHWASAEKGTSFEVRATYFSYESSSPSAISTGHTDGALLTADPRAASWR